MSASGENTERSSHGKKMKRKRQGILLQCRPAKGGVDGTTTKHSVYKKGLRGFGPRVAHRLGRLFTSVEARKKGEQGGRSFSAGAKRLQKKRGGGKKRPPCIQDQRGVKPKKMLGDGGLPPEKPRNGQ